MELSSVERNVEPIWNISILSKELFQLGLIKMETTDITVYTNLYPFSVLKNIDRMKVSFGFILRAVKSKMLTFTSTMTTHKDSSKVYIYTAIEKHYGLKMSLGERIPPFRVAPYGLSYHIFFSKFSQEFGQLQGWINKKLMNPSTPHHTFL